MNIDTDNITTKYLNLDYRHKSICVVVGVMEGWELRKFTPDSDGDWTLRFHCDPIGLEFMVDAAGGVACVFRRGTAWIRSWDWEVAPTEKLAEWIRAAKAEAENHFKA